MGLSLNENIIPSVKSFQEYIQASDQEIGRIFSKAPDLLACSWKGNLKIKLQYLNDRLHLEDEYNNYNNKQILKYILQTAPRIILYSLKNSIQLKLTMIDEIIATTAVLPEEKQAKMMQILYRNPSLLARTNNEFKKKLESAQRRITNSNSTLTLETALLPPKTKSSSKTATAVGEAVNSTSNKTNFEDLNSERVEISKLTTTAAPKPDNATTVNATTRRTVLGVLGSSLEDITTSRYKLEQEYDDDVIQIDFISFFLKITFFSIILPFFFSTYIVHPKIKLCAQNRYPLVCVQPVQTKSCPRECHEPAQLF